MQSTQEEVRAVARAAELEGPLCRVEERLHALGAALHHQDAEAVDRVASELHAALVAAIADFSRAARSGGVPASLRTRLALVGGQVAAQREAMARATAALDRAIEVLMPRHAAGNFYSAAGNAERGATTGSLLA